MKQLTEQSDKELRKQMNKKMSELYEQTLSDIDLNHQITISLLKSRYEKQNKIDKRSTYILAALLGASIAMNVILAL